MILSTIREMVPVDEETSTVLEKNDELRERNHGPESRAQLQPQQFGRARHIWQKQECCSRHFRSNEIQKRSCPQNHPQVPTSFFYYYLDLYPNRPHILIKRIIILIYGDFSF